MRPTATQRIQTLSLFKHVARRYGWAALLACLLALIGGTALAAPRAAQIEGGDIFRLPANEIVEDDLYVAAREVYIEGIVQGDLVAAGSYIEVTGSVAGDALLAGGSVVVRGVVQDDARLAGSGVSISGQVGDDLFMAGGGGFPVPFTGGGPTIAPGLRTEGSATIGGDAFLTGGVAEMRGAFGGDLSASAGTLLLNALVNGGADLNGEAITVDDSTTINGVLTLRSDEEIAVPAGVASGVNMLVTEDVDEGREPVNGFFWWLMRTLLVLIGLALLAWLLLTFVPSLLERPADAIDANPTQTGAIGLGLVAAAVPIAAIATFLLVLFWGWFPGGVASFAFFFGALSLLWFLSPLVTGLWIGRKLVDMQSLKLGRLATLVLGVVLVALVGRLLSAIPFVGEVLFRLLYLASLAFALGGIFLASRSGSQSTTRNESPSVTRTPVGSIA